MATTSERVDLSDYEVTFTRTVMGWRWDALSPSGEEVPAGPGVLTRLTAGREAAEAAALRAIERHAAPEPPLNGEELRQRVQSRTPMT